MIATVIQYIFYYKRDIQLILALLQLIGFDYTKYSGRNWWRIPI